MCQSFFASFKEYKANYKEKHGMLLGADYKLAGIQ